MATVPHYLDFCVNQYAVWRLYISIENLLPVFEAYKINPNAPLVNQLYQLVNSIRESPGWDRLLDSYPILPFAVSEAKLYPHFPRLLIEARDFLMGQSTKIPEDWMKGVPISNAYVALLCQASDSSVGAFDWAHLIFVAGHYGITFPNKITAHQMSRFFTTEAVWRDLERNGITADIINSNWCPRNECQFYAQIMHRLYGSNPNRIPYGLRLLPGLSDAPQSIFDTDLCVTDKALRPDSIRPGSSPDTVIMSEDLLHNASLSHEERWKHLLPSFDNFDPIQAAGLRSQILARVTGPDVGNAKYQAQRLISRLL